MNSSLKYLVPLGLIVAVIFGVTLISQNTPDPVSPAAGGDGDDGPAITSPPLNFTADEVAYNPDAAHVTSRLFPGVFEVSDAAVPVTIAFQNPNKVPVRVAAVARSCTACTAARVMTFTEASVNDFLTRAAVASLPGGAFDGPSLLLPLAVAGLVRSSDWQDLDFDRRDRTVEVPACAADGAPTWGFLQVGFQIRAIGGGVKDLDIGMTAGKMPEQKLKIKVGLGGAPPFLVHPRPVAFGELPEGTPPRTTTLYVWSATRPPDALPAPVLTVNRDDPFLTVGEPRPMTPAERDALAREVAGSAAAPRVSAGWKLPVTVFRRRPPGGATPGGPVEPDVGPFTREIGVTVPGTGTAGTVTVTAKVTGLVALADGEKIDLKTFNARDGVEKAATLVSDRPDLSLEPAPDQTKPSYLGVAVGPPEVRAGRRVWPLKVTVPKDACVGDLPPDSFVVLRARTKDGVQMVHLQVVGRGASR